MVKLNEKRALSVAEAAKYACVSRGTVECWIARKLLPFEELPGRGDSRKSFRKIRLADLDEFLDSHYQEPKEKKKKPNRKELVLPGQITLFPRDHGAALKKS